MASTTEVAVPVRLKIIIIGAGIAGLASALSLGSRGHHVTVLEAHDRLAEFGAGIQLMPNTTKILCRWGLRKQFEAVSNIPDYLYLRRYSTDEIIGGYPHNPEMEELYGSPQWQIHRADFQRLLYEAAIKVGVEVEFGKKITSVDGETGTVLSEDDTSLAADLVIGADGIWSKTRDFMIENAGIEPVPFKQYTYRAMVPRERMLSNPITAPLMTSRHSEAWVGPGQLVLAYPVASDTLYNVAVPVPRPSDAPLASWNEPGDVEAMRALFQGFAPVVTTLFSLVDSCAKWTIGDLPPLKTWVSESGRLVLVGDAAHAATPHAAQGGAMAVEDATVLGECLAGMKSPDDLRKAVMAYQAIRKPRCEHVQQIAKGNADMLILPDGPEQEERDRQLKETLEMSAKRRMDIENGVYERPNTEPDPNATTIETPGARMWLYGYDALEEARSYLANN